MLQASFGTEHPLSLSSMLQAPQGAYIWELAVLCCAVLCCAVLCCAVLCCAVLCCAVLCCAVLCCAVLCCAVLSSTVRARAHLMPPTYLEDMTMLTVILESSNTCNSSSTFVVHSIYCAASELSAVQVQAHAHHACWPLWPQAPGRSYTQCIASDASLPADMVKLQTGADASGVPAPPPA
jgi:hypothetical protein